MNIRIFLAEVVSDIEKLCVAFFCADAVNYSVKKIAYLGLEKSQNLAPKTQNIGEAQMPNFSHPSETAEIFVRM